MKIEVLSDEFNASTDDVFQFLASHPEVAVRVSGTKSEFDDFTRGMDVTRKTKALKYFRVTDLEGN